MPEPLIPCRGARGRGSGFKPVEILVIDIGLGV
jgi:hypothetical protein